MIIVSYKIINWENGRLGMADIRPDMRRTYGVHTADGRRTYGGHTANIRRTYGEHTANIGQTCATSGCGHTANIRHYDISVSQQT